MLATLPQFSNLTPRIGLLAEAAPTIDPDDAPLSPTLRGLFGDLDVCECRHCASVLSPAAYFVDLLEFIKRNAAALAALLGHRPDLLDLELSCENTETELPHIDLVLEILRERGRPAARRGPARRHGCRHRADGRRQRDGEGGHGAAAAGIARRLGRNHACDVPDQLAVAARRQLLILNGHHCRRYSDRRRRWGLLHHESGFFAARAGLPAMHKLPLAPADSSPPMIAALNTGSILPPRDRSSKRS